MTRVLFLLGLLTLFVACDNANSTTTTGADTAAASSQAAEGCQCGAGKTGEAVWCDKCGHGYVDGKKVTDKAVFAKAQGASAGDKGCGCGDKADCKCGDKADCKCGDKAGGECGAAKKAHDCGGDCDCANKHACACAKGKEGGTVWCDKCGVGYIDGKKATDRAAVDKALDKS
jgi:hypothetical protein